MVNSLFQKVYVITCDPFVARQTYIRQHFAQNNIQFEFRSATQTNTIKSNTISESETSLVLAHLHCVIDAKLNCYDQILICEDDVELCDGFDQKLDSFIEQVPVDWQFLQLGNQYWATHWLTRDYIKPNLYRFRWGTGSHCVAIKNTAYDNSISILSKLSSPVDLLYYELFSKLNCYCPEKFLADALSKNDHLQHSDKKYIFDSSIIHKNVD
jgi:hypothetical protein